MLILINAHDPNNVIGKNNVMPWHIKEELAFFKKTTINHSLLMGRNTFEGIGKALPNRTTYLLTTNHEYNVADENVIVINDAKSIIEKFKNSSDILFIAGGQKVYEQFINECDELIVSIINSEYDGDAYFPNIDLTKFTLVNEEEYSEFTVKYYKKINVNI